MRPPNELIELARSVGSSAHDLCIEAEGNVSTASGPAELWIKGSGCAMATISEDGFAQVRMNPILEAVRSPSTLSEADTRSLLNDAKCDPGPALPSTETFMHAFLLARDDVSFVAHAHPTPLLSILVLPDAESFASKRLFPDEIVLCGPATCFVPYVAPGLPLARAISARAETFRSQYGVEPKTFWLQNHGLIVVGRNHREVLSAALMAVKAARVLLGALQTGREPKWLSDAEVDQIYRWPDEHARQRALWGVS